MNDHQTQINTVFISIGGGADLKWSDATDQLLFFVAPFYILLLCVVIFKNLISHEEYINSIENWNKVMTDGWLTMRRNLDWFPTWRTKFSSYLTGAQDSHLQTVMIPEAARIQLRRRPPEDEQGNARNM